MTDKQIMEYVITNCPCYSTEHSYGNCIASNLGYRCEDNVDCPIRATTTTRYANLFDIEEIEK